MRRHVRLPISIALVALALVPAAGAHVQVTPATAAPGDSTLFTVLMPNEEDSPTVQLDLQIPDGLIPFSFEETPGWTRTETRAPDESIDVVTWKGSLPAGEFVRFSFLASTPEQDGELAWPAVQTYADGTKVRWIGPPDSESPAAVTVITSDAASEKAGGGGTAAAPTTGTAPSASTSSAETVAAPPLDEDGGGLDTIAIVAISAGAVLGVFGLWTLSKTRRRTR